MISSFFCSLQAPRQKKTSVIFRPGHRMGAMRALAVKKKRRQKKKKVGQNKEFIALLFQTTVHDRIKKGHRLLSFLLPFSLPASTTPLSRLPASVAHIHQAHPAANALQDVRRYRRRLTASPHHHQLPLHETLFSDWLSPTSIPPLPSFRIGSSTPKARFHGIPTTHHVPDQSQHWCLQPCRHW